MSKRVDISGKVINKWRIIDYSHTTGKIAYYNCICLGCGKDFKVDGRNIRNERSKSCVKCARPRSARANRGKVRSKYDSQTAAFRGIFSRYKKDAKRKKRKFSITFEEFRELVTSNCFYCTVEPSTIVNPLKYTGRSIERENEGWIKYNGVDRVNSSIGYVKENVVSCCSKCNYGKHRMSIEEFKEWIERIHKNLKNF